MGQYVNVAGEEAMRGERTCETRESDRKYEHAVRACEKRESDAMYENAAGYAPARRESLTQSIRARLAKSLRNERVWRNV